VPCHPPTRTAEPPPLSPDLDGYRFLELALRELKVSAASVSVYAALLDAQLPTMSSPWPEVLNEIRARAAAVEALITDLEARDSTVPP
jgi:hypothetical protein